MASLKGKIAPCAKVDKVCCLIQSYQQRTGKRPYSAQIQLPTKGTKTHKTPYELWKGSKPDLSHLRVFGSKAYVHIPKEKQTEWDTHAEEGALVDYCETSKGYRIVHQATNI